MGAPKSIQIIIPNPCHESWDEMTQVNGGRFCAYCKKKVTDFTGFTDSELYRHITNHPGGECGRYLITQVNRPIKIPYQPQSRLYQMAIAMGLTLIFTQAPQIYAQKKPPLKEQINNLNLKNKEANTTANCILKGRIFDEKNEPLINATIQLFNNQQLMAGNVTDYDGNYTLSPLNSGKYDVVATYYRYDSIITSVQIKEGETLALDLKFAKPRVKLNEVNVIVGYKVPLIKVNPEKIELSANKSNQEKQLKNKKHKKTK